MLLAAASTIIPFLLDSQLSYLVSITCRLVGTFHVLTPFGAAFTMQSTGLKSDDVSLGIPPAWPGQGLDAIVYLQDS